MNLSFVKFYRQIKMRDKIILFFLAVFGIWFIFIFAFYSKSNIVLQSQIESGAIETLEQAQVNLTYRMKEMEHISNMLYRNEDIQEIISRSSNTESIEEHISDYFQLKPYVTNLAKGYDMYQMSIYIKSDILYSKEAISFYNEADINREEWYKEVVDLNGGIYWAGNLQNQSNFGAITPKISLLRVFKDFSIQRKIGVLRLDMNESEIQKVLEKINVINKGESYLIDQNSVIISGKSNKSRGEKINQDILDLVSKNKTKGTFKYGEGSNLKLIIYRKLENANWTMLSIIPYKLIFMDINKLRNFSAMFMVILLVVSVILVLIFSYAFTRRIQNLSQKMSNIESNNFSEHIELTYDDEIGKIEDKYNEMSKRIGTLISEVYDAELKKKGAELKALQAQINPHFLYNTLDTINWMAVDRDAYDISFITTNLGKFYRKCLSKGKEIITIQDEIEITKTYLKIQQIRLKDLMEIEYDIPEEILPYLTVKLILQPIVENAIKYGVQPNIGKKTGKIIIRGEKKNDRIRIQIIDNGEGFNSNTITEDHVLNISDFKLGYGLNNVKERLFIYFGQQCELTFTSSKDIGSIVQIEWPAILLLEEM